jgi:hypothetical protein
MDNDLVSKEALEFAPASVAPISPLLHFEKISFCLLTFLA